MSGNKRVKLDMDAKPEVVKNISDLFSKKSMANIHKILNFMSEREFSDQSVQRDALKELEKSRVIEEIEKEKLGLRK